jgi:integrase
MVNYKFIIRRDKKRDDGKCPLFLRIYSNGQVKYLSTKVYIPEKHWDEKKQRIIQKKSGAKNDTNAAVLNEHLRDFQRRVESAGANTENKSVRHIQAELRGNGGKDFVTYAQGVIESIRKSGQYWNAKNMQTALTKLINYNGDSVIPFGVITAEYLRMFQDHLIDRGNRTNTITKNMGSLKRIFSIAEKERKIKRDDNPFHDIKLKKERSEKQKLSIEEIRKIEGLELPEGSLIWHVKNYFLFSFYTGGTRFIDLCYLKWKNIIDGRLQYRMSKTSAQSNVKLLPPALRILEYYEPERPDAERFIFPLLSQHIESRDIDTQKKAISSANALINKYLKKIRERGEIETHISFHIARHSFADFWRKSGGSLYSLSKMLRHSSLSITEQYLKSFDAETVDEEMDGVFSKLKPDEDKTLKLVQ